MAQASAQESAEASRSDYRCLAMIEVPTSQVDLYYQLLYKARSVFVNNEWHLLAPAQKTAIFDASGAPPGLLRRLLHVWEIPDFNSLTQVMADAADNEDYVKAQALTTSEAQNLYVTLTWDSPIGPKKWPINFYLMETLRVVNDTAVRKDLEHYMGNAIYLMNSEEYKWTIVFAGNATTGAIDEYVNVWGIGTTDATQLEAAITHYRNNASWTAAVHRVTTTLWTPRSVPNLDEQVAAAAAAPAKAK